jgi:centrosomal CEP192-like protein/ASPM-SPD-2-Hydin domain-containing protein
MALCIALRSIQKRFAAVTASQSASLSRSNFPITLKQIEATQFQFLRRMIFLAALAGVLPAAAFGYGGAFTDSRKPSNETPSALSCTTNSMTGAGTDNCTVSLKDAATGGGLAVKLASNNSKVSVPTSVTVAAGSTSATFTATISAVSKAETATLSASANRVTKTFAVQLGVTVQTLSLSSSSLSFGSVNVNTATMQTAILSSTGASAVTVSAATVAGTGFSISGITFPITLSPNQTAALTVQFDPTAAGADSGTLTLASNSSSGGSTLVSLSGSGLPVLSGVTCSSGSMSGAGTDSCSVSLNVAAATGGFTVSLASNDSTVTVPASVTVAAGATTASLAATVSAFSTTQTATVTASANSVAKTITLQLTTGAPTLSLNATSIAFGDVIQNSPATQSVTLSSTGTAPVTVTAAGMNGTGFSVSGATFPLTLNPTQTATLSVEFDPIVAGPVSGTLTVSSNSSTNPTATVSLTATGETVQVNMSWNAPSSSPDPVAGYNVYRSPSGGTSYQQLNGPVLSQITYVDTTAQAGQTYDYIVESVDASGNTSTPSNMASVTLP